MHEVKQPGEKQKNDWLSEALRELGATSTRHAPPYVGAALQNAFVRRHAARRRAQRQRLAVTGLAAMMLLTAGIALLRHGTQPGHQIAGQAGAPGYAAAAVRLGTALSESAPPDIALKASRPKLPLTAAGPGNRRFMSMPSYDPPIADEDLRVVRLQLSGEALRRVGIPIQEENTDRLMFADFVVGQDGTPYAFRLVSP